MLRPVLPSVRLLEHALVKLRERLELGECVELRVADLQLGVELRGEALVELRRELVVVGERSC